MKARTGVQRRREEEEVRSPRKRGEVTPARRLQINKTYISIENHLK